MSSRAQLVTGGRSPAVPRPGPDAKRSDEPAGGRDVDTRRRRRLSRSNLIDTSKVVGYLFKVADTCEEIKAALHVVYTCYREFGLIPPSAEESRVTFHHVLPDSHVLVAKKATMVHSTLTMVPDGCFGLPMDHEFGDRLAPLRKTGARLAEITSLATLPEHRQANLFMYLYKLLLAIGLQAGLTDFVLVINPKHVRFYRDLLLFEQIGPERSYGAVSGAPGVPFRMNIERTLAEGHRVYQDGDVEQDLYGFFSSPWQGGEVAIPKNIRCKPATLCRLFAEILRSLGEEELAAVSEAYRDAGFEQDWQRFLGHAGIRR